MFIFILGFTFVAFLGCLLTSSLQEFDLWIIYIAFNLAMLCLAFFMIREFSEGQVEVPFQTLSVLIGWAMFLIALAEQLHAIHLPGESRIFILRPAALTGSFLHYPLIMTFFAYISIQWGKLRHSRFFFWSGVVFASSALLVASRSGLFIVLFTPLVFTLLNRFKESRKILFFYGLFVSVLLLIAWTTSGDESDNLTVRLISRISSAAKTDSIGNSGRILNWKRVINDWLETNMLLGEYTGIVTNSTANLKGSKVNVAESGLLQLLINFGLLGMLLFYGILFQVYRFIKKEHVWLRAFFIAAITQTLFYQSTEVLPYMILMLMLPLISQSMAHQQHKYVI